MNELNVIHQPGDHTITDEEMEAQNRAAAAHPDGVKAYWRGQMVGVYQNACSDPALMTEQDFDEFWQEEGAMWEECAEMARAATA